jgi:hypothetical protein
MRDKLGPEATDALVICCSDRRIQEPVRHFLSGKLGLTNYDLLAMPGGVYVLSADVAPEQTEMALGMATFLVEAHLPPRIVLIAHQDCGRYLKAAESWETPPGFSLGERQRRDLLLAVALLREKLPGLPISAFFQSHDSADITEFSDVQAEEPDDS